MRNAVPTFALFALAAVRPVWAQASPAPQTPPLQWVFQTRHDAQTNPHTDVFLRVGSRRVLVLRQAEEEFRVPAKTNYKDAGVPAQALTACLGWWAGAGDNLYVVRRGRSLVVYRREVDEQAPDLPWKRFKVISLP